MSGAPGLPHAIPRLTPPIASPGRSLGEFRSFVAAALISEPLPGSDRVLSCSADAADPGRECVAVAEADIAFAQAYHVDEASAVRGSEAGEGIGVTEAKVNVLSDAIVLRGLRSAESKMLSFSGFCSAVRPSVAAPTRTALSSRPPRSSDGSWTCCTRR